MAESKKSSPIWSYFSFDIDKPNSAICKFCNAKLTCGPNPRQYSTSPMIQHMKAKHLPEYKLFQKASGEKSEEKELFHATNISESSESILNF